MSQQARAQPATCWPPLRHCCCAQPWALQQHGAQCVLALCVALTDSTRGQLALLFLLSPHDCILACRVPAVTASWCLPGCSLFSPRSLSRTQLFDTLLLDCSLVVSAQRSDAALARHTPQSIVLACCGCWMCRIDCAAAAAPTHSRGGRQPASARECCVGAAARAPVLARAAVPLYICMCCMTFVCRGHCLLLFARWAPDAAVPLACCPPHTDINGFPPATTRSSPLIPPTNHRGPSGACSRLRALASLGSG
jgi:hypothetical protein